MSAGEAPQPLAWWHRLPGVCNHLASRIGGECGRPDDGAWVPLYPGPDPSRVEANAARLGASIAIFDSHLNRTRSFTGAEVAAILRGEA